MYPAGQILAEVEEHMVAPIDDEVPAGHDAQALAPLDDAYSPESQAVQVEPVMGDKDVEYFPGSQDLQVKAPIFT